MTQILPCGDTDSFKEDFNVIVDGARSEQWRRCDGVIEEYMT